MQTVGAGPAIEWWRGNIINTHGAEGSLGLFLVLTTIGDFDRHQVTKPVSSLVRINNPIRQPPLYLRSYISVSTHASPSSSPDNGTHHRFIPMECHKIYTGFQNGFQLDLVYKNIAPKNKFPYRTVEPWHSTRQTAFSEWNTDALHRSRARVVPCPTYWLNGSYSSGARRAIAHNHRMRCSCEAIMRPQYHHHRITTKINFPLSGPYPNT